LQHEADDQDHGCAGHGAGHLGLSIAVLCRSAGRSNWPVAADNPVTRSFYTASVDIRRSREV
ncbi:MAG TPA: hypothetical protein PK227_11265, partial [Thermomonas sp.]|nr:hypothetical protein [Thermomonas sp.]HPW12645.1 hypothetical protein [Thermomonas sp.]